MTFGYSIRHLGPIDSEVMYALLQMFGEAFNEPQTYVARQPSDDYMVRLLESDYFIALAAVYADDVVGGIVAYELKKFEQQRSEIYIYDLAVVEGHRRRGVATALIDELRRVAAERGAYVIFVQADTSAEDQPAIALYTKMGVREEVLHFDIAVESRPSDGGDHGAAPHT